MKLQYKVLKPKEIEPYVEALRTLEKAIHYPINNGEDAFFIDHGSQYHPFFYFNHYIKHQNL